MTRPSLFSPPTLYDQSRWAGLRIGLLGGTFNPPHHGHLYLAKAAMRWLKLDAVWWVVSPGHPLKPQDRVSFAPRLLASQKFVKHPRIVVTDIEKRLGTHSTASLADALRRRYSRTNFVFIGGFDIAAQFQRWVQWRHLLRHMPFAFLARPPAEQLVQRHMIGQIRAIKQNHLSRTDGTDLSPGLRWITGSRHYDISSTQLRRHALQVQDCITPPQ